MSDGTSQESEFTNEFPFEEEGDHADKVTVSEFLEHAGYKAPNLLVTAGCGVAVFQYGALITYVNLLCVHLTCTKDQDGEAHISNAETIVIKVLTIFGVFIGLPLAGMISDRIGRTRVAVFGAYTALVGWFLASFSDSLLFATLFCTGVGFSALLTPAIVTAVEFSSITHHARVFLVLFTEYLLGQAWTTIIFLLLVQHISWIYVTWIIAIPGFLFLIIWFHYIPESPVFLAVSGRQEQAYSLLLSLHRANRVPMKRGTVRYTEMAVRGECCAPCTLPHLKTTFLLLLLFFLLSFSYTTASYSLPRSITSTGYCGSELSNGTCGDATVSYILPSLFSLVPDWIGLVGALFLAEAASRRLSVGSLALTAAGVGVLAAVACLGGLVVVVELAVIRGCTYGALTVVYMYTVEWYPVTNRNLSFNYLFAIGLLGMFVAGSATWGIRGDTAAVFWAVVGAAAAASITAVFIEKKVEDVDVRELEERQPFAS